MKKIQSVVALGLMLLICLSVQAQWASFDTVVVVKKPDGSQQTVIGPSDVTQEASYHWDGPNIVSGFENNPHAVVRPQNDGEVYTLTRTTACGEEKSGVLVRLVENPVIVSVTPKRMCYNEGDPINISDFEIVTYPSGYEWMVTVYPNQAPPSINLLSEEGDIAPLIFTLDYGNNSSSKIVTVDVYRADMLATISIGESSNPASSTEYLQYAKILEELQDVFKDTKNITHYFQKLGAFSPCVPQFDYGGELSLPMFFYSCCNDAPIICFRVNGPVFKVEGGMECDLPLPFLSIGKSVGFFANLRLFMGLSVGPFDFVYKGQCSTNAILPVGVFLEVSGGVKAMVFNEHFLSASLYLAGMAQTGFNWIIGKEFKLRPIDVDLSIKGKITAVSLFSYSVNVPLKSWQFFNN